MVSPLPPKEARRKPKHLLKRPPNPGAGRPVKQIDVGVLKRAAMIGCTSGELAAVLGVDYKTFLRRLDDDPSLQIVIEEARDQGRATLRRLQWQGAHAGDKTMLIWLGKQMLGQRDHHTIEHRIIQSLGDLSEDELLALEIDFKRLQASKG